MSEIILTTLNARYIHSSFGLRYLLANMGELQPVTFLREFTIDQRPIDIAEQLLATQAPIIGFGVYIWNATQILETVALIKTISPETCVVLGGPEISHETDSQALTAYADFIVTGNAEISFAQLCRDIIHKKAPIEKIISSDSVPLSALKLPYDLYTEQDIAHRVIYVEASRGCPFKCEFCLSALDKTAKPFELNRFLKAMEKLYDRGVRSFKFVDRTFNLNTRISTAIMQFFLDRISKQEATDLFVHFEVIPDRLPAALKAAIAKFPPGVLQFEVGVQTFNPEVQKLISRKQNNDKTLSNIKWLRQCSHAHLHTDLIFGLPGESLASMSNSFDTLYALKPHEIQVGILKRLKGMPMIRLESEYKLHFNPHPPYDILSTNLVDFNCLQRLRRFARFWDLIGNSGRFPQTLPLILADAPFGRFLLLSDWLFSTTEQTHKIGLRRLFERLYLGLPEVLNLTNAQALNALEQDYRVTQMKGQPNFLRDKQSTPKNKVSLKANHRQLLHLSETSKAITS